MPGTVTDETTQKHETETKQAESEKTFSADYVRELRAENKQWRQKFAELETSHKTALEELTKSKQSLSDQVTSLNDKVNKAKEIVRDSALTGLLVEAGITDPDEQNLLLPGLIKVSKAEVSDELQLTYEKEATTALIKKFRQPNSETKPEGEVKPEKTNVSEVKNLLKPEPKFGLITETTVSDSFRKELASAFRIN
jgi:sugar-specific transcriptional regulator TrmB